MTFKDDCSWKARLAVHGFTDQRFGKIPTCSPPVSRRSSSFLDTCCVTWFSNSQRDVKSAFLQGDLDEQHADNNNDADKIESVQPVSDTFCESVPQLSRKLQLEHHQCVRLLKAVFGLVNVPGRWCDRVATDLRNMRARNLSWNLACGFSDTKTASFMLCVWFMSMTLACSDPPFGKHVLDSINILHEWGIGESRVFTQCGARITQAFEKHTRTWSGFEISFTECAKEISIITLPSHRRRDSKSRITPLELSQLRALNGQLLWLGVQCLPQLLAPVSLLMEQTPQTTVDTIYEVTQCWLGRRLCGPECQTKSMLIILLLWSRTQMLDGPPDQTALRKGDSKSSLQTPNCCKAKNQTCL